MFLPDLSGGGAERVMARLAGGFVDHGVAVDLLVARRSGPWVSEVNASVRVLELGGRGVVSAFLPLTRYLVREKPAALLSTLHHANVVACAAHSFSRAETRLVLREASDPTHVGPQTLAGRVVRAQVGRAYRRADTVIALAESMKRAIVATMGVKSDDVVVIPNPVSASAILAASEHSVDHPWFASDVPLVVGAGRLHARKDFATLIRAVAVLNRTKAVRLMILGEGPERASLSALASELDIASRLALPGFAENVYPWLRRADVVASSSLREGMPNLLLEALVLGKPVVATDCPTGPREVLEDGRLGALVPIGDHTAMAAALQSALSGPNRDPAVLRASVGGLALDEIARRYLDALLG